MGDMTVNAQEAAAANHPVLYDNFYLVQYLLDKKAKFIHPVNCRSLISKQHGNYQQAAFRHPGRWESYYDAVYLGPLYMEGGCPG